MYSREGGSPARGPQRKPLVPCPWERGRGAGPGAGGIANMPHVQFSVTDAYDAGIRRIDRQVTEAWTCVTRAGRQVLLRHTSVIAIGAKDLLPDSPPTAGASIGRHGSAAMSRPPMMSPTITHFQSGRAFFPWSAAPG